MTYICLFETPDYVYCGQHRIADNKDPMKDSYKGSGSDWIDYLKENGYWYIKDFRKNVKKTILEIVMDDTNHKVIGNVEKFWISWTRETYGDKCINISQGSKPNTKYNTVEEAEEAEKAREKSREKSPERIAWHKSYYQDHKEERKSYQKSYNQDHKEERKVRNNINHWAHNNNFPDPAVAVFPKSWTDLNKNEYKRQYIKHLTK